MNRLRQGFVAGYECLASRADLLDRINVFPVADGDTGTNLRISLAPLRNCQAGAAAVLDQLAQCATGNSGNIAAAFFREFLQAETLDDLAAKAALGRAKAWQAVATPRVGTMLSIFDSLATVLATCEVPQQLYAVISRTLHQAVLATTQALPDLRLAEVVDSGALGMFVFFEGFFATLTGQPGISRPIFELFQGRLKINPEFQVEATGCYCVDAVIKTDGGQDLAGETFATLGESVVVLPGPSQVKLHIHTPDPVGLRTRLASFGEVVGWSDEAIDTGIDKSRHRGPDLPGCLHIMSDAAGSLPRDMARRYGMTLLDSYIVAGDQARPESLCVPKQIYSLMRQGQKVTTAQASTFERHQHYRNVCEQFGGTLYLCVGSAFTGNYATVMAWKKDNDPENRLVVIDTGAASGRLGLIALLVARYAEHAGSAADVVAFARKTVAQCEEYVFIDTLQYLAAGGRVSRARGFFGDLLQMKPVVSPTREGVRKVGRVRNREGQLAFALEKLSVQVAGCARPVVLLQYADNEPWVASVVQPQVRAVLPQAEIVRTPLSLTSGVHMGPGTWSVAFAPGD